ncbi:villin, putative [Ixodes scapularis]|uniref:Villin, putative n=1 Tax=Ixodes scapularis TaxID=6945 RepID=B7Q139_IXOSC|nr:villin, putative [Ixodes scapularis]|eukprot:XP_002408911.1 villin, putative [Ixodes scapularis]
MRDYLQDDPSCRDLGTPVIWVKQGLEPPNFTGFFTSWDNDFWKLYLNDEEFLRIFSMAYEEFEGLPKWKKLDLKKKVGLF